MIIDPTRQCKTIALATICFVLAACRTTGGLTTQQPIAVSESNGTQVVVVITDPASEEVLPGTRPVDAVTASNMFVGVCNNTYPDLAQAKRVIATMPFKQNPSTGTYYHQQLDLSLKLINQGGPACSMVFGSRQDFQELGTFMSLSVTSGGEISASETPRIIATKGQNNSDFIFRAVDGSSRTKYYSAVLSRGKQD